MNGDHHYAAHLIWTGAAQGAVESYDSYSREYEVRMDGKPALTGSADPSFKGDPALHNPEDLLLAALSACHMLSYLALCAKYKIAVTAYEDPCEGTLTFEKGQGQFTRVLLKPKVTLAAGSDLEKAKALHERAHGICFIARSVNFPVEHAPEIRTA